QLVVGVLLWKLNDKEAPRHCELPMLRIVLHESPGVSGQFAEDEIEVALLGLFDSAPQGSLPYLVEPLNCVGVGKPFPLIHVLAKNFGWPLPGKPNLRAVVREGQSHYSLQITLPS